MTTTFMRREADEEPIFDKPETERVRLFVRRILESIRKVRIPKVLFRKEQIRQILVTVEKEFMFAPIITKGGK